MALTKQDFTYVIGEIVLPKESKLNFQTELIISFSNNCVYKCQNQFDLDTHTCYQISFSINYVGFEASEKLDRFFTHLKKMEPTIDIKLHAGINFYY